MSQRKSELWLKLTSLPLTADPDYKLKCIGYWKENLKSYLITYDELDPYSKYRCWVSIVYVVKWHYANTVRGGVIWSKRNLTYGL